MFPAFDSAPIKSQCRYCPQTFAKFNELIKHEASHHIPPPPPPPPPPPQDEIPVENGAGTSKSDEEGTSEEEIDNEDYEVNDLLDRFQDYWENIDNFDNVKQTSKRVRNTKPTRKKKTCKPKGTVVFDCSIYNMRRLKIDGKSKFQCLTCMVVLSMNSRERLMIHQRTHNPSLNKRKSISSFKNKATSNSVEMTNQNRSSKVKSFDCSIYNMERIKVAGQRNLKFKCLTCSTILSSRTRSELLRHQRTHQGQQNVATTSPNNEVDKSVHKNEGEDEGIPSNSNIRTTNDDWVGNYTNIGDSNQKKMKCLRCDKIISYRALRCHFLNHIGEKPFICNFEKCPAAFSSAPYLNKHRVRVHGPKGNKASNRPGSSKRFFKVTPTPMDYSVYGFEKVKIDGSKSKYKCVICCNIYTFHSRERFIKHQKAHNKMLSVNNHSSSSQPNKLENFSNAFSKKSGHFQNGIYSLEEFANSNIIEDNEIEEPLSDLNRYVEAEIPPINPYVETLANPYVQNDNSKLIESTQNFEQIEYDNLMNNFVKISSNRYECIECHKILSRVNLYNLKRHLNSHDKRERKADDFVESKDNDDDFVEAEDEDDDYTKALQNAMKVLTKEERISIIKETLFKNVVVKLTRLPEEIVLKYSPKITITIDESGSIINTSSESESQVIENESEENPEYNYPSITVPEFVPTISNVEVECNTTPDKFNNESEESHESNYPSLSVPEFVPAISNVECNSKPDKVNNESEESHESNYPSLSVPEFVPAISNVECNSKPDKVNNESEESHESNYPSLSVPEFVPAISNVECNSKPDKVNNESEESHESNYPSLSVPEFVPAISNVECNSKPDKVNNESEESHESNYPSLSVPEFVPAISNVECNSKPDKVSNEFEESHESNYPSISVPDVVPTISNVGCNSKPDKVNNESEESHESNYPSISVPDLEPTRSNVECNSKPGQVIDNEIAEIIESIEKIESHKAERLRQKQISKTIDKQPSTSTNNIVINQDSGIEVKISNENSVEDKKIDQDQNKYQMSELIPQNGAICEDENGFTNLEGILVCANSFSNDLIERENEVNSNGTSLSKKEHNLSENEDQLTNLYQVDGNNEVSSLTNSAQNEGEDLSMSESNNFNEVDVIGPEDDNVYIESIENENTPSEDESTNNDSVEGSDIESIENDNTPSEDESTSNASVQIEGSGIESSEINHEIAAFNESIANKVENEKEISQPDLQVSQNQVQTEDSILSHSIFDEKEMNTSDVSIINSNQIDDENQKEVVGKNYKHNNETISIGTESMLKVSNLSLPSNQEDNESADLIEKESMLDEIIKSSSEILSPDESNLPSVQNQKENEAEEVNLPLAELESQITVDNVEKALSVIENENKSTSSISFDSAVDANGLVNLQNEKIITTSPIIDEIKDIKNSQQESRPENTNSMDVNESMSEVRNLSLPSNQEEIEINDLIEKESKLEEIVNSSPEICESESVVKQGVEINQKVGCKKCSSKSMRKLEIRNIFKFSISLPEVENKLNESMPLPLIDDTNKVRSFCYEFRYNETEDTSNTNKHDSTELDEPEKVLNIGTFAKETHFFSESVYTTTEETESSESIIEDSNTNELSSVINESNLAVDDRENEDLPIKNECSSVAEMIFHEAEIIMNDSPREQPPEDSDEPESLIPNSKEPSNIVLDGVLDCVYVDSRHQQKVEGASSTTSNENVKVADNLKLKLKSKTKTRLKLRIKTEIKSKTYLKKRKSILSNRNKKKIPILRTNLRHRKSIDNKDGHRQLIKVKYDLRRKSSQKKLESIILPRVLDCNYINESKEADQNQNQRIVEDKKPILTSTNVRSTRSSKSLKEINIEKLGLSPSLMVRKRMNKVKKTIYKRHKSKRIKNRLRRLTKAKSSADSKNKNVKKNEFDLAAEYNFEVLEMSGKSKYKCLTCLCVFSNGSKDMLKGHQNTHNETEKNENIDKVFDSSKELRRKSSRIKKEKSNSISVDKNQIIENTDMTIQLRSSNEKNKIVEDSKKDISNNVQNVQSNKPTRILPRRNGKIYEYKQKSKTFILFDSSIYNMKRLKLDGKSRFQCLTCSMIVTSHSRDRLLAHQRTHSISSQKEINNTIKGLRIKKKRSSPVNEDFNDVTSDQQSSQKLSKVKLYDCSIYNMERVRIPGQKRKFKCLTCLALLSDHGRSRLLRHQRMHQRNTQMEITSTTLQNNEIVIDETENYQNILKSEYSPNKAINGVPESSKSAIQTSAGESYSDDWMAKFEKIGKHYRCLECNNELRKTWPSYLRHHYNMHFGIRPFECSKCSKSFFTKYNLRRHNDRVHLPEKMNEPKNDAVSGSPGNIPNDLNISGDSVMLKILSEPIQTMIIEGPVDLSKNYKKPESACEIATGKDDEDSNSLPNLFPQEKVHNNYQQVSVNDQGKSQDDQNKATTSTSQQKTNTIHNNGPNFYDWTDDYIKIEFGHDEIEYECTSCKQILYDPSIDALKSHKLTHTIRIPQYKKNKIDGQFGPIDSGIISNSLEMPISSKRKSDKNESNNKRIRIYEELDLDLNDKSLEFYCKPENEAFRKDNYKPVVIGGKVKNECLTCGATISSNLRRHFRTHNKPIRP